MKSKPAGDTTEPRLPTEFRQALAVTPRASAQWRELTPIARMDFVTWIESAKQTETRKRRIEKACSMLAAGKRRPCCYSIVSFDLHQALSATPKAKAQWSTLAPTQRREFISWMDSAKDPETHSRRIEKACAMLAAGMRRPGNPSSSHASGISNAKTPRSARKSQRVRSVSDYLASLDSTKAKTIKSVIDFILVQFPQLESTISWNVPQIHRNGKYVAGLAAFENHLTFAPWSSRVIQEFKPRLGKFVVKANCFQIPVDWEIDAELMKDLVRARLAELE